MKSTAYTKGLLLLIALLLGIIAFRPSFQSDSALAQNSAKLNLQVLCSNCLIEEARPMGLQATYSVILDQNTGKVWAYPHLSGISGTPTYLGVMSELGKPLQLQKR